MKPISLALASLTLLAACDMGKTTIGDLPDPPDTGEPPGDVCEDWTLSDVLLDGDRGPAMAIAVHPDGLLIAGGPVSLTDRSFAPIWTTDVDSEARDVVVRSNGGALVAGPGLDEDSATGNATKVTALSADGVIEWQRNLGPAHYMAWAHTDVRERADGGAVVSWHSSLDDGVSPELRLAAVSADGTLEFENALPLAPDTEIAINWSQGSMELLPNGNALQLTAAGPNLRLVQTSPQGQVLSDVVMSDVFAWPKELEVLPDGTIFALANSENGPLLLEVTADATVIRRHIYEGLPDDPFFDDVAWHDELGALVLAGEARDDRVGQSRNFVMMVDRDGSIQQQILMANDERGGLAFDIGIDPEGGAYIGRHWFWVMHIQYLDPFACHG